MLSKEAATSSTTARDTPGRGEVTMASGSGSTASGSTSTAIFREPEHPAINRPTPNTQTSNERRTIPYMLFVFYFTVTIMTASLAAC